MGVPFFEGTPGLWFWKETTQKENHLPFFLLGFLFFFCGWFKGKTKRRTTNLSFLVLFACVLLYLSLSFFFFFLGGGAGKTTLVRVCRHLRKLSVPYIVKRIPIEADEGFRSVGKSRLHLQYMAQVFCGQGALDSPQKLINLPVVPMETVTPMHLICPPRYLSVE